jgi:hypothetical protein
VPLVLSKTRKLANAAGRSTTRHVDRLPHNVLENGARRLTGETARQAEGSGQGLQVDPFSHPQTGAGSGAVKPVAGGAGNLRQDQRLSRHRASTSFSSACPRLRASRSLGNE